jgi:hypothetical protein
MAVKVIKAIKLAGRAIAGHVAFLVHTGESIAQAGPGCQAFFLNRNSPIITSFHPN